MKQLLKDPRVQLSITLSLIFLSAIFFYHKIEILKLLFFTIGSAVIFDLIFLKLRKIELFPPTAAITSGLIISLLVSPSVPVYEIVIATFFAMLSKNFMRRSNKHIFNPAGFGVLAGSIIFKHPISWWAVSFQQLNSVFFLILLSPLLISVIRLKRFPIILPFLVIYSLSNRILNNQPPIVNLITDPTVLFFSIVMLPEPMTSPNNRIRQVLYAIFVAVVSSVLANLLRINYDPLLFGLLTGNLIFYGLK